MALRLQIRYALVAVTAVLACCLLIYALHIRGSRYSGQSWGAHGAGLALQFALSGRDEPRGKHQRFEEFLLDGKAKPSHSVKNGESSVGRHCPKKWRPQITLRNTSALKFGFFNRGGFNALLVEAQRREWNVLRIIPASLPVLESVDFIFTHPSAYSSFPILLDLKASRHLISAAQGMQAASGPKSTQVRVLRQHAKKMRCDWNNVRFLPLTFILSEPSQCREFFEQPNASKQTWILKPTSRYGGDGIRLVRGTDDLEKVKREFTPCHKYHPELKEDNRFVIQEYIERPLLLHGRKFDVRMYMLLASTKPFMLLYRPGYIRAALQMYNLTNTTDLSRHLTNTHVQELSYRKSNSSAKIAEHFWSLEQFQHYLDKYWHSNAKAKNFVYDRLVPFAKNSALYVFHAGKGNNVSSILPN